MTCAAMKPRIPLPTLFLIAPGITACFSLISRVVFADAAIDLHLHDTYYVMAHSYVMLAIALYLLIISALYYIVPKLSGRRVYYGLGVFHLACTVVAVAVIFWPTNSAGVLGAPRRYYDYTPWNNFRRFVSTNTSISIMSALLFLAQIVCAGNLLVSAAAGKRLRPDRPGRN